MSERVKITEFRNSVTPDLYDTAKYIAWASINDQIVHSQPAIDYLESIRTRLTTDELQKGLRELPRLYEIITALLVIPRGAGFADGRELPDPATPIRGKFETIAQLLIDVGLPEILTGSADIASLLRVGLTAQDSLRRRYRVGATIEERILSTVLRTVATANETTDWVFSRLSARDWPESARGKVDHVVAINGLETV